MLGTIYRYLAGKTAGDLGAGMGAMAYQRSQTLPLYDGWMRPRYQVRGTLATHAPAYVKMEQQVPSVSLRGNGLTLQGQLELQALAQLTGGGE